MVRPALRAASGQSQMECRRSPGGWERRVNAGRHKLTKLTTPPESLVNDNGWPTPGNQHADTQQELQFCGVPISQDTLSRNEASRDIIRV